MTWSEWRRHRGPAVAPMVSDADLRSRSRRSWAVGVLVLVGILGLPTVGLVATNHLIRQASERQARETNALAAGAVSSEVAHSYQQRLLILRDIPARPSTAAGLARHDRALLERSLRAARQDGGYCRLVLRAPGIDPVVASGPGPCWSPPAFAPRPAGISAIAATVVHSTGFTGLQSSGAIPGYPRATLQAVFAVKSLISAILPGVGARATIVSGMLITSSSDPALVGRTLAAPAARASVEAGRPASSTIYSPYLHTEVIAAFDPVAGTDLGVFFSVTTKVAYAEANHVSRMLFYGYLGLLAVGLALAALVVVMLRRRDRAGRRSAQALRESEERLRQAFEHAPIGKALIDLDGRYQQVNAAMCALTGYSDAQLRSLTVTATTHPDDVADGRAAMDRLVSGEQSTYTLEKRYVTPEGVTVWAAESASLVRRDDGTPLHFVAQIQDITERKQHERVLAKERRRLRDAEAIGQIGSWEMDIATQAVIWSDSLLALYGIDAAEFGGDYAAMLPCIYPEDREKVDAAVRACASTGAPIQVRHRVNRANDGQLRWFDASGARDGDGPEARLVGAVIDVTDHVSAAETMEEARDLALEASRQKSAFLATMSHEIRTPMNAVIGMTGLLLDTALDADQLEFVTTVRTSGDALLGLINDILDFSKIEAGGLQLEQRPFDLRDCIDDSLELVAATPAAQGLELVGFVDERCATRVLGDVTRLRQVLVNLLGNAVKFTGEGEVVLVVEPDDDGSETGLRFSVTDTGIGIPSDRITTLFDAFSQVDASTTRVYGGSGLGLAIAQRLVDAMGGTLGVESAVGTGSTFSFSVALQPSPPIAETSASRPPAPFMDCSALVVDDNSTSRRMLRQHLESWGMNVTEAANGDVAVALVASGDFDVAVVDMQMPGMSGPELAVILASSLRTMHLPLVLLTGRGETRQTRRQRDLFSAVIAKPVRSGRLRDSLRDALLPTGSSSAPVSPPAVGAAAPRQARRVLLAEDNAVNQRLGRLMLEKLGHHVDVVSNGREATRAVGLAPYDIVLMDVEMPEMDGLEATRVIRRELADHLQPRIVAMTASALVEDRRACNEAGMDGYLAKPVHLRDLEAALDDAARLDGRDGAVELVPDFVVNAEHPAAAFT